MRNLITFLLALLIFSIIHEGAHILTAMALDEYKAFDIKFYGLEVSFKTPEEERNGFTWALISGTSNIITIALGYCLFAIRHRFVISRSLFFASLGYWLSILFLTIDPLNLSIGALLYGGDATGIAIGLNLNRWLIQGVFLIIFLVNREIVAQRLIPDFGISTVHPLFRPWFPKHIDRSELRE
jgi:magnesium-transporting ATPase (P-type)